MFQNNSLYTPFKRTSSIFGSRHLTHDLFLPIDECHSGDIDYNRLPELRTKHYYDKSSGAKDLKNVFRVNSLQISATHRLRLPVSRITSSPTTFQSLSKDDAIPEEFARKMSFRHFLRRWSSRRRPMAQRISLENPDFSREKRKLNNTISIK